MKPQKGFKWYGDIAPISHYRVQNITGDINLDMSLRGVSQDVMDKLSFHLANDDDTYGERTGYDGYRGYHGDE